MKKIQLILSITLLELLVSCSGNKPTPTTDSTKTAQQDTSTKIEAAVAATDMQENLNLVLKDILSTIKSKGDLSVLNKYVYPGTGFYEYYQLPDMNSTFERMDQISSINGDEANGPGPDAYLGFEAKVGKIDTSKLVINYDSPNLNECLVTKKGVFDAQVEKPFEMMSMNYSNRMNTDNGSPEAEVLAKLKKVEAIATDKIILNLWDNSQGNSTVVLYFGKVDKKYYFLILNLANYCDNE